MKKIVLLAFLCLPLGMKAQEVKIAHVNTLEIFNAMPETSAAETELANLGQSLRTELQRMEEEYNRMYTQFMQQQDSLPQSIKIKRMQEIEDKKNRTETFYQQAEQEVAKKKEELNAPIAQKIQAAIKAVGDEQGYTYMMESRVFAYTSPKAIDATPFVKAKLGIK